jgi:hypothetical protein
VFNSFNKINLKFFYVQRNYFSPSDPTPSSVSKILANVRLTSASTATTPSMSDVSKKEEVSSWITPSDEAILATSRSPLGPINTEPTKSKRKSCSILSSVAKKRKETTEDDIGENLPRRKLFRPKKLLLPQDPVVALTPDESPKARRDHPCFSQVGTQHLKSQNIPNIVNVGLSHPNESPLRRDSLADFKLPSPKKQNDKKLTISTLVCTSVPSE